MTLNNKTKENIIKETTKLIQRYGYAGTSIKDIIKKSKSPKGSLYYYFPKGKDDIILNALDNIDEEFSLKLKTASLKCNNLEELLLAILELFKNKKRINGTPSFRITLLSLETINISPKIYKKCGEILKHWKKQIAYELEKKGCEKNLSIKMGEWYLTTIQGSICASVIHKDINNMDLAEKTIKLLISTDNENLKNIFI